jgi:hypothetical protein
MKLYFLGILSSIIIGTVFPFFAYVLSNVMVIISGIKYCKPEEQDYYQEQAFQFSLMLFWISLSALIFTAVKGWCFVHIN